MNLYQKFKEICSIHPERTAIIQNDEKYTYKESLDIVDRLSTLLNSNTEKKYLVFICLRRSASIVFSQLATNAAGHIFTCVDIKIPQERKFWIREKIQPRYLILDISITYQEGYTILAKYEDCIVWERIDISNCLTYLNEVTHIYFSSGSTGEPKGILLQDKAVIDVVLEQASIIGVTPQSKFAWLLSPSFDASLSDIYLTLLSGATLCIAFFEQTNIKTLIAFFNKEKITHSDISPSILNILDVKEFPFLKGIIFGGELSNEQTIKYWGRHIQMFNAYGPTEATICSSLKRVDETWTGPNVGHPLPGVHYEIAEDGELLIGGAHLGIGYLDETLTKEKFTIINGKKVYKTGDLMRKNESSGDYFFIGRKDRQFKHNGVLVCPEEIEKLVLSLGCHEAYCHYKEKIILYFSGPLEKASLRYQLTQYLPESMIPQVFIKEKSLNKSINGKVTL